VGFALSAADATMPLVGITPLLIAAGGARRAKRFPPSWVLDFLYGLAEFSGRLGLRMCNWALRFRTEFRPFYFPPLVSTC